MKLDPNAAELKAMLEQTEAKLEELCRQQPLPGLSIAIVYDQEILWARGFGYANREQQIPATPKTVYHMASITKLFTATMLMQLRDRGLLQLDDEVAKYLPAYKVRSRFADHPPTTLRQLATHTSGLPKEGPFDHWQTLVFPSAAELLAGLSRTELFLPPMSRSYYSNLGIAVLGYALEVVAGQPYKDYVREQILRRLGMNSSGFSLAEAGGATASAGYIPDKETGKFAVAPRIDIAGFAAAGQLCSSAEDMARFIALQFSDDPAGGRQLLAGSTLREMRTYATVDPNWETAAGIGWSLSKLNGGIAIGHAGDIPGFTSSILLAPAIKLGVAAFTNTDQGEDNRMEDVTHDLLSELVGVIGGVLERSATTLLRAGGWRSYLGHYAYPGHPGIDIEFKAGNLVGVSRFSGREYALHPTSEHHFRVEHNGQTRGQAFFEIAAGAEAVRFVMGDEVFERGASQEL